MGELNNKVDDLIEAIGVKSQAGKDFVRIAVAALHLFGIAVLSMIGIIVAIVIFAYLMDKFT